MRLNPLTRFRKRRPSRELAVDAYLAWREECVAVRTAYLAWRRSRAAEAALAFDAYQAALDSEEGHLADAINQGAGMRAWDLWRKQVRSQVNW